jgi:hypothetical protein
MNSHPLNILSAPCTPFVIGYSLNRAQLIALAPRICSAEELSSVSASYPHVALNRHMKSKKLQEGFLPYKEADGLVYYLWFKGVVPSFTGNNPNAPVPPIDLDVYPSLRNLDALGHVKRRCIVWPKYLSGTAGQRPHSRC